MNPSIVFTGGGTAGHVTPNIALIHAFKQQGWDVAYIGSADGVEQTIIKPLDIPFYAVSSGKLRRYFSLQNALDPFKVLWGIMQCTKLFFKHKPDVVFSKGGFVAFPVVVGAFLNRIPVIAHESDMTPGLANRLCYPFVTKICVTFEASKKYFKNQSKVVVTGTPLREQLFTGQASKGLAICGFSEDKPCILVIGGSTGANSINAVIRGALDDLTASYQVIHICGKGKIDGNLVGKPGYYQLEYAHDELADLFAAAAVVISRSGANSLCEILALGKPHILVPLSAQVSRGDQIHNAAYFEKAGVSTVIQDAALTEDTLLSALEKVMGNLEDISKKIKALHITSATHTLEAFIKEHAHVQSPRTV